MNESQKRLDEKRQLRIRLENISIVLLAVFSFFLFLLTFFPFSRISQSMQASFEMGRMVQRAFSIVLFVLSLQLWKRKRNAWMIAMGIFTLNFLRVALQFTDRSRDRGLRHKRFFRVFLVSAGTEDQTSAG